MFLPKMCLRPLALAAVTVGLVSPPSVGAAVSTAEALPSPKPYLPPSAASVTSVRGAPSSPFLPPLPSLAADPNGAPIEFRGVTEDATGRKFRLYNPARKLGAWVALNQRNETLDARAVEFRGSTRDLHDSAGPAVETLVVEYQGRLLTLTLCAGRVGSIGFQVLPTSPTATDPKAAEGRVGLKAVSEEVLRLRASREGASKSKD